MKNPSQLKAKGCEKSCVPARSNHANKHNWYLLEKLLRVIWLVHTSWLAGRPETQRGICFLWLISWYWFPRKHLEHGISDYCISLTQDSQYEPSEYRTRAIISRSQFEAALVYKPRILSLKNEEFSFLVHKLSVI